MTAFWGYAGADLLAIGIIGGLSVICLICGVLFVRNY